MNYINRVKKLRETLVAVQQLDKNMSILRSWLAHIETELSKPIAYDSCDFQEIQRKLDLQQVNQELFCQLLNQLIESCYYFTLHYFHLSSSLCITLLLFLFPHHPGASA